MYSGIIYCATSPSGKKYYGVTLNFKSRKYGHKRSVKNGVHSRFYSGIRKYGFDNFKWEIIESYEDEDKSLLRNILFEREVFFINKYKTNLKKYGYNMTKGGDGRIGVPHTEETKLKLSKTLKGRKHSKETKQKMSDAHKGKKLTNQHKSNLSKLYKNKTYVEIFGEDRAKEKKEKMSDSMQNKNKGIENGMYGKIPWNKDKFLSEETKKKISEAGKGQKRPKNKEYRKKISEGLKRYHKNKNHENNMH